MIETPENRIKRMKMRSMRRGIKEMDMILSAFADRRLEAMDQDQLDLYDAMLSENDHDLYQWIIGRSAPPERFAALIAEIAEVLRTQDGVI